MAEEQVVRSVRIPLSVDKQIRRIAEYEDRTMSKIIQRLLQDAVEKYLQTHYKSIMESEEAKYNHEMWLEGLESEKP